MENHILQKICRVCLLESKDPHPIFTENYDETSLNIHDLLTKIVDIQLSESEVPNIICENCFQFLVELKKFQELCLKSDKVIRDHCCKLKLEEHKNIKFVDIKSESLEVNVDVDSKLEDHVYDLSEDFTEEADLSEDLGQDASNFEQTDIIDFLSEDNTCDLSKEETNTETTNNKKPYSYYLKKNDLGHEVYACNLCPTQFLCSSSLKNHITTHGDKSFVCNECKKSFDNYQSVLTHSKRHSIISRFKCELCDKSYIEKASLKVHMRAHRDERPFLCSVCGKGFRQNSDLKTHLGVHTEELKFICNFCGKGLKSRSSIQIHLRSHTGERPYFCTECPKTFRSSDGLKRHKIIHTGLKPFTCPICQKSFNRTFTLKVHVKSHSKERPHVCEVCDKRFTQAHSLRSHRLLHERDNK